MSEDRKRLHDNAYHKYPHQELPSTGRCTVGPRADQCALRPQWRRQVDTAAASRSHGIGILFDGASDDDQRVEIALQTTDVTYTLKFDLTSGRMDTWPGEVLETRASGHVCIRRKVGASNAALYNGLTGQNGNYELREPDKLTLGLYLDFNPSDEDAGTLDRLLHFVRLYNSRSFALNKLKSRGSESSPDVRLWAQGDNVWSVLRNLHDRKGRDDRFDTIIGYMRKAFPSFEDLSIEQTGPRSVYASFFEKNRSRPILASGVSDGHLQLLIVLTALFSESRDKEAVILLDEPELSLHPWALTVLANAIRQSSERGNQILVSTHSPVLISQFARDEIIVAESDRGQTGLRRLSNIQDVQDLLDQYAAGALYMSDTIGSQAPTVTDPG